MAWVSARTFVLRPRDSACDLHDDSAQRMRTKAGNAVLVTDGIMSPASEEGRRSSGSSRRLSLSVDEILASEHRNWNKFESEKFCCSCLRHYIAMCIFKVILVGHLRQTLTNMDFRIICSSSRRRSPASVGSRPCQPNHGSESTSQPSGRGGGHCQLRRGHRHARTHRSGGAAPVPTKSAPTGGRVRSARLVREPRQWRGHGFGHP